MSDMTRAEAIKILSECKEKGFKHTFYTLDEYHTAMDIAINSLQIDEQYDLMYEQAEPTGWIPVKYRPMTDEEKREYSERTGYDEEDLDFMLDCPLPEDGETVLITDRLGNVEVDTFIFDCDGCYFECNCDMDDVKAWMPLPKPYEP